MSLVVSAYWTNPVTGESEEFTDWENGHHMAGAENARWNLWGTEAVKRRGAKFLPRLSESDLWVTPAELEAFIAEVRCLLSDVEGLRTELGRRPDCSLPYHLDNFLRIAEYAAARRGGVNIT